MTAMAHIPEEVLYDYALGESDATLASRVRAHLPGCPACSAIVAEAQFALSAFAFALPEQAPQEYVRHRLMEAFEPSATAASARAAVPNSGRADAREKTSPWAWITAFSAAAAFAALLAAISLSLNGRLHGTQAQLSAMQATDAGLRQQAEASAAAAEQARRSATAAHVQAAGIAAVSAKAQTASQDLSAREASVAQREQRAAHAELLLSALNDSNVARFVLTVAKTHPQPQMRALYRPATGQVLLTASALPPLPAGKVFELWWIGAAGAKPAGVFRSDASGGVELVSESLPPNLPVKGFAVTIEQSQGAVTPTLPIVLASSN